MVGFVGELSPTVLALIFAPVTLITYYILFAPRLEFPPKAPKQASEQYPFVGALGYFSEKWDFYRRSILESPSGSFSFYLGKHAVVGLAGDIGREAFYNSRDLGITQGQSLNPRIPGPPELPEVFGNVMSMEDKEFAPAFMRFIHAIFTTERFSRDLPVLIQDAKQGLSTLTTSSSAIINPFDVLYRQIFQFTVREICCNDIPDDPRLLDKMISLFRTVDSSFNPRIILFPSLMKLLSPAYWKQMIASVQMYLMVKAVVDGRKKAGKSDTDPMQHLLDQGIPDGTMIKFMLAGLFAGIDNSTKNAAWNLVYLAANPKWKAQVLYEVEKAATKHLADTSIPLAERLSSLPLDVWETEFPTIDMVLTETIRLHLQGVQFRKHVGATNVKVGDEIIPPGAFVLYHNADIHLDPQIYPNPQKWDPSRHTPEKAESKKKRIGFVGWGAGRHNCGGIRFAKFENNIAVAFFVATYDFELCDSDGNIIEEAPTFNINNQNAALPDRPAYLRIRPR